MVPWEAMVVVLAVAAFPIWLFGHWVGWRACWKEMDRHGAAPGSVTWHALADRVRLLELEHGDRLAVLEGQHTEAEVARGWAEVDRRAEAAARRVPVRAMAEWWEAKLDQRAQQAAAVAGETMADWVERRTASRENWSA